jgi:hypothetical protein
MCMDNQAQQAALDEFRWATDSLAAFDVSRLESADDEQARLELAWIRAYLNAAHQRILWSADEQGAAC